MMPVEMTVFDAVFAHMAHRVAYLLGAKAPSLDCDSSLIHQIDCSGFARYIMARATKGAVVMPDGSQAQLEWCRRNLDPTAYPGDTGSLVIAFLSPSPGDDWPRHVWYSISGFTRESCGHKGVCALPWNTPPRNHPSGCFLVPTV